MIPSTIAEVRTALTDTRNRVALIAPHSRQAARLLRFLTLLEKRLTAPLKVVLLGEFNAGKSTLANALIGAEALPTSIHANTRVPLHARYASSPSLSLELLDGHRVPLDESSIIHLQTGIVRMIHVAMPAERLTSFELIDTPGLAFGTSKPEQQVVDACRRAHIAIWCTAATQAWKATEAAAWSALPSRFRSRSMLVATLVDALNTDRDRSRLEMRLGAEAKTAFSEVVLVSAAEVETLRANQSSPDYAERWTTSGGAALDAGLQRLLDAEWSHRASAVQRVLSRFMANQLPPPPAATEARI